MTTLLAFSQGIRVKEIQKNVQRIGPACYYVRGIIREIPKRDEDGRNGNQ